MATKTQTPAAKKTSAATPAAKKSTGTEVALRRNTALAVPADIDMDADAGGGLSHIDADSMAIPFLIVLQKSSPKCDPDSAEYDPDAKPGMFMNTVTGELFEGKEDGVLIVPANYIRKFLRWAPRELGGGFKGEIAPEEVVKMREQELIVEQDGKLFVPDDNGNVNPKRSDKIADTRVHYCLFLHPETGEAQQCVLSLASTQIKKSKQLISLLLDVKATRPDGSKFTPASFASVVRIRTVPEQNDKGSWSGVKFELEGLVQDAGTYAMARAFSKLVDAGKASVNFEAAARAGLGGDEMPSGGSGGGGDEPPPHDDEEVQRGRGAPSGRPAPRGRGAGDRGRF